MAKSDRVSRGPKSTEPISMPSPSEAEITTPSNPQTSDLTADQPDLPSAPPKAGWTVRSFILGLVCVAITVYIVTTAELVSSQVSIGYLQLPPVVLCLLFLIVLVNMLVKRIAKGRELKPTEIALIYIMILPAAMVTSHGMLERLLSTLAAGNYFASPDNGWRDLFYNHTPSWLVPWDPRGPGKQPVTVNFYEGIHRHTVVPWGLWIRPVLAWFLLFGMVYFAFLCMASILRRQWGDNEHLTFPLVQLPMEFIRTETTNGEKHVFSRPLTWIGFTVPFFVFNWNGLHNIYPTMPLIVLNVTLNPFFTTPPLNDMGPLFLYVSFAAIGFFFLLPSELLFSLWFFFLIGKGQEVFARVVGYETPNHPHAAAHYFLGTQTEGAWVALAFTFAVLARKHLSAVWAAAIGRGGDDRGQDEMLSYRVAVWGLIAAFGGIVIWCVAMGMSAWLAIWIFAFYLFVQAIIMARSTAEAGMLMTEGSWTSTDILRGPFGSTHLDPHDMTALSYTEAMFPRDLRGMLFTGFLDAQRLADAIGIKRKTLLTALVVGVVSAAVMGAAYQLYLPYHLGALTMQPYAYQGNSVQFFRENAGRIHHLFHDPTYNDGAWAAVGVVVTLALSALRARYAGFPLHPLGYALCCTWTIVVFWFPILVAWICKAATVRYGGVKGYRFLRPFFIGMVLGEFFAAFEWTLISGLTGAHAPTFPWP